SMKRRRRKICPAGWVTYLMNVASEGLSPIVMKATSPATAPRPPPRIIRVCSGSRIGRVSDAGGIRGNNVRGASTGGRVGDSPGLQRWGGDRARARAASSGRKKARPAATPLAQAVPAPLPSLSPRGISLREANQNIRDNQERLI